jgi:hypothetical protein
VHQATSECGYGWLGLGVFVVCVQSYKKNSPSSGLFRVKVLSEVEESRIVSLESLVRGSR